MASILSTPCHTLLPEFIKPLFTSDAFVPHPASTPIPLYGAIIPPLTYFLAIFFLSAENPGVLSVALRYSLAAISAATFFALPFQYHVPGSAIFTYQLGLIGCFGAARVLDIFFLSGSRKPKRVTIPQPGAATGDLRKPELGHEDHNNDERNGRVYPDTDNLDWTTDPQPESLPSRLWYALDLMISMRGIGWDFASADVRHDISPWQPPSRRQLRMACFRILPALGVAVFTTRSLLSSLNTSHSPQDLNTFPTIIDLPPLLRPVLVLATGISLYTLFDGGYTIVSAILLPIMKGTARITEGNLHNVDFFPLLNPLKLTEIKSVRSFWSKAWHRLFHRAFLVFGILPFQNLALLLFPRPNVGLLSPSSHPDPGRLLPKGTHDWAKVLGAFFASGFIHAVSERAALGGRLALPPNNLWLEAGWAAEHQPLSLASTAGLAGREIPGGKWSVSRIVPPFSGGGEFTFFALNGVAVLVEGVIGAAITKLRKQAVVSKRTVAAELVPPMPEESRVPEETTPKAPSSSGTPQKSAAQVLGLSGIAVRPTVGLAGTGRRHTSVKAPQLRSAERDSDSDESSRETGEAIKRAGTPPRNTAPSAEPSAADAKPEDLVRWYDRYVGLFWAVAVLLWSGEAFVEGWIKSGILAELSMLPH